MTKDTASDALLTKVLGDFFDTALVRTEALRGVMPTVGAGIEVIVKLPSVLSLDLKKKSFEKLAFYKM